MYAGRHDVYPTIYKKLVDNIFSSNFVLLSMC